MKKSEVIKAALTVMETAEYGSPAYELAAWSIWHAMDGGQKEVFRQLLFKGPVWDGDIVSKAARHDLFAWGLAVRVCFKGEQGYTAATYPVFSIWKRVQDEQAKPSLSEAAAAATSQ